MDINDILSGLSEDDMARLRETAKELLGNQGADGGGFDAPPCTDGGSMPDLSQLLGNAELLSKLSSVMGALNKPDRRSDLLRALKPLLSEKRRTRVDEAAQIIRLIDLLPLLQSGFGTGKG